MSKTVTIPMSPSPYVVTINNTRYEYKAGATVSVPDEVAALIEANAGNAPVEYDPTVRLVTEIGEDASDKQYPTAKAVMDAIEDAIEAAAPGAATKTEAGLVKMCQPVDDPTDDTVKATLIELIAGLKQAGIMETPAETPENGAEE